MKYRIGIISLGCPKNLVDSEIILGILKDAGFDLTHHHAKADAIIVNTCAFIGDAAEEAVIAILEAARWKKEGQLKTLIVTGCLAQRYKEDILKEIPEADFVVGTGSIDEIPEILKTHLNPVFQEQNRSENKIYTKLLNSVYYLELPRLITDNKPYAYLKIAEGCSNHCTYCIIPGLRGAFRSRTMENIVKEARMLAEQGKKEIILVAQDVTNYGADIYGQRSLTRLIRAISKIEGLKRIRLLYCYPDRIDEELISEISINPKICKYLDIPIQHISDRILKNMGRRDTKESVEKLIGSLRSKIPGIILRTTLITGFPGESEDDFNELVEFVNESKFEHLGVFAYSREEGTPAFRMKGQIPKKIREARRDKLMQLQQRNVEKYNNSRIGCIYDTIVDGVAEDGIFYVGRTYAEAPEIDPVIYFTSKVPLETGDIVRVEILCADGYDLIGENKDVG